MNQFAGLGFTILEAHLLQDCWREAKTDIEIFINTQFAGLYTGLQLSVQSYINGLKVCLGDLPHKLFVTSKDSPMNQGYFNLWDSRNFKIPPAVILGKRVKDSCYQLQICIRNAIATKGSYLGLHLGITWGYHDKNFCTPDDEKWCYDYHYLPYQGRTEAALALKELTHIRTIYPSEDNGSIVYCGSREITGKNVEFCKNLNLNLYYKNRNPLPQRDGWMDDVFSRLSKAQVEYKCESCPKMETPDR